MQVVCSQSQQHLQRLEGNATDAVLTFRLMCRYDKEKLSDELIDTYRMPQLVRGWEDGLIRFFLARVSGESSDYLSIQHCAA